MVNKAARTESIAQRKQLFKYDFFQNFPIVILAVGHYVRDHHIDLQALFGVDFIEPTIQIGHHYWINIHQQKPGNTPKLLLHTNQLSMISNELIDQLVEIVKTSR